MLFLKQASLKLTTEYSSDVALDLKIRDSEVSCQSLENGWQVKYPVQNVVISSVKVSDHVGLPHSSIEGW